MDESLDAAAIACCGPRRICGACSSSTLYSFGEPGRDPRTRVISVAYYALVTPGASRRCRLRPAAGRHQRPAGGGLGGGDGWAVQVLDAAGRALPLAFDHAEILGMAVKRLRGKLDYAPIGFQMLARPVHPAGTATGARDRARTAP
jgi:8-oxo-dGTP diphosphatase